MLIGYCRVSTADQYMRMQEDALKSAGCKEVYTDVESGVKTLRPELEKALACLRHGDTFVILKFDQLGRSIIHLNEIIQRLSQREIGFKSIQDNIDTTTSDRKLILHTLNRIANFELDVLKDQTESGLNFLSDAQFTEIDVSDIKLENLSDAYRDQLALTPNLLSQIVVYANSYHHDGYEGEHKKIAAMIRSQQPELFDRLGKLATQEMAGETPKFLPDVVRELTVNRTLSNMDFSRLVQAINYGADCFASEKQEIATARKKSQEQCQDSGISY